MILVVTGTGTDVGKTVVTAALAACASGRVAVVKPVQTGVPPGRPGDLAEVTRLTGISAVHELRRYPDALSPHHAAAVSGLPELGQSEAAGRIVELDNQYDLVLVEGAGGLLVPYARKGWTLLDLVLELDVPVVVVTQPGLGTLNHTALTMQALDSVEVAGIVVGSWPPRPDLAMRWNLADLGRMSRSDELAGVLPQGLPAMADFPVRARAALGPRFGGTFDWPAFRAAYRP